MTSEEQRSLPVSDRGGGRDKRSPPPGLFSRLVCQVMKGNLISSSEVEQRLYLKTEWPKNNHMVPIGTVELLRREEEAPSATVMTGEKK